VPSPIGRLPSLFSCSSESQSQHFKAGPLKEGICVHLTRLHTKIAGEAGVTRKHASKGVWLIPAGVNSTSTSTYTALTRVHLRRRLRFSAQVQVLRASKYNADQVTSVATVASSRPSKSHRTAYSPYITSSGSSPRQASILSSCGGASKSFFRLRLNCVPAPTQCNSRYV
jgi:hypothetical protein